LDNEERADCRFFNFQILFFGDGNMSHFRECKLKLKNVDAGLLTLAVAEVAKALNRKIVPVIKDYYGRVREVLVGVDGLYGVDIKDGEIVVVGDEFGKKIKLEEFRDMVVQEYTVLAIRRVLAARGYNARVEKLGGKIYVYGVRV